MFHVKHFNKLPYINNFSGAFIYNKKHANLMKKEHKGGG